jgi:AraC family transcriptional regulator
LPRSTLRDVKRKLTFVPAGHEYREWQEARRLHHVCSSNTTRCGRRHSN